jgi:hypothetical protein
MINANPRRYGGYMAHLGLIMSGGRDDRVVRVPTSSGKRRCGRESGRAGGYNVRFDELWANDEPHRFVVGANA